MANISPFLIYFIGAIFIPLFKGWLKKVYLLFISAIAAVNIALMTPQTSWIIKFLNLKITLLEADKLSLFVGYIFILIGVINVIYVLHVEDSVHHVLAFLYVGSSLGVVFSGDYLSLYVFWEIMALSSTGLIWLNKERESIDAGFRYLFMHLLGGAFLLGGILLQYQSTNSFEIVHIGNGLASWLLLAGIGLNSAFILLHTWLPDSYPRAPFTASIFMSVYTTKTAVYMLARIAYDIEFVAYVGAAMTIFGVSMALLQSNARKLLSYHIVSQVGYMVAGIGLGGAFGIDGGIFHLFNHILYKALLFMTIGAVIYRTGVEDLSKLGGVLKKMPVTTIAAIVASLSIAGVPPFNGFVSKSLIFEAAHKNYVIYLMLELAAVGTLLSFLKFTYFGFIRKNETIEKKVTEVPFNMKFAMAITAVLCLTIGLIPSVIVKIFPIPLEPHFYTFDEVFGSILLVATTVTLFIVGKRFFEPHTRVTYDFDYFYLKGSGLVQLLAQSISNINNALEDGLAKIIPALLVVKDKIAYANNFFTRLIFSFFVDLWLFKPITPSVIEENKIEDAIKEKPYSVTVDWLITQIAKIGERLSYFSGKFDNRVIDGIVNSFGHITIKAGEFLRPIQTGDIQNYGMVIVLSSTLIILVYLLYLIFSGLI